MREFAWRSTESWDKTLDLDAEKESASYAILFLGIMTENEFQEYENVKTRNLKYFVPMLWFNNLLSKARQEGRIFDGMTYNLLLKVSNQDKGTDRNCLYELFFGGEKIVVFARMYGW